MFNDDASRFEAVYDDRRFDSDADHSASPCCYGRGCGMCAYAPARISDARLAECDTTLNAAIDRASTPDQRRFIYARLVGL